MFVYDWCKFDLGGRMRISKLKQKNILKYQHKILKYKQVIKHRDMLSDHIKDALAKALYNTSKVPHNDEAFFLTKIVQRRGWLWIKSRWNHNFKWSKYRKLHRSGKINKVVNFGGKV